MSTFESMTDEELALSYINGNNRAFDELLSRSQDKIFNYIIYIVKDENLANDLSNLNSNSVMDGCRESEMANAQVLRDVKKLMEALPEQQREVVFMRYYQELSFKEIAKITGVSINTSLGRMRYALINLRKLTHQHGVNLVLE